MGNFLPKYPKNYFKNQKGLRSFWKMISIGISIIFGILACIDKFEKQWELNVFYFGIALLLFYIFIHPVWMINFKIICQVRFRRQMGKDTLRHGAAADVAVADKKYFYHCCITSHFLVFLGFSGFVSLCKFLLSGITWFIFA